MIAVLSDLLVTRVMAANPIKLNLGNLPIANGDSGLASVMNNVIGLIFGFLGLMAFIGVVYSGIMMITAGGDASKFAAGKKNLLWSVIGVAVVVLALAIIRLTLGLGNLITK